jgi:hypothetical protein
MAYGFLDVIEREMQNSYRKDVETIQIEINNADSKRQINIFMAQL